MAKPRGRAFQPGNKASRGRPRGSRNPATVAAEKLFEQSAEPLAKKCIQLATKGDAMALRLAMERVLPPCKNTLVHFEMPAVETVSDLPVAANALLQAVARGEISPADSQQMMAGLEFIERSFATMDFAQRLQAVEKDRTAKTVGQSTGEEATVKPGKG